MARVLITGSADGLGQLAADALIAQGHKVVLHGRNEKRGLEALDKVPGAETVVTADLSSVDETKRLASKVNALGKFDAVIHNAGVYQAPSEEILAVNTLAPYILTCLVELSLCHFLVHRFLGIAERCLRFLDLILRDLEDYA